MRGPGESYSEVIMRVVESEGAAHYVRLSALSGQDAPFTLPFSDPMVKRRGGWLYSGDLGSSSTVHTHAGMWTRAQ